MRFINNIALRAYTFYEVYIYETIKALYHGWNFICLNNRLTRTFFI